MAMTAEKQTVFDWIDQHRAELSEQHLTRVELRGARVARVSLGRLLRRPAPEGGLRGGSGQRDDADGVLRDVRPRQARARRLRGVRRGARDVAGAGDVPQAARRLSPLGGGAYGSALRARDGRARRRARGQGGDGAPSVARHHQVLRRAGREGVRLEARARRPRLLRRPRRRHQLSSHVAAGARQLDRVGHALRRVLEQDLHVRVPGAADVGERGQPRGHEQLPHHRPRARRPRRRLPHVHHHQVHEGVHAPAPGHVDAQRVHPRGGAGDVRQPGADLQPDPVLVALPFARDGRAHPRRARAERAARGGHHPLPGLIRLGDADARRPAQSRDGGDHLSRTSSWRGRPRSARRRRRSRARSRRRSTWRRWTTRSCRRSPS